MRNSTLLIGFTLITASSALSQICPSEFYSNDIKEIDADELKPIPDEVDSQFEYTNQVDPHASGPAKIIKTIPSPSKFGSITELAFDGKHLWVAGYNEMVLRQVSIEDGRTIRTIPTTIQRLYGLTFDGKHLWLADADNLIMQQIDTITGKVLQTVRTPGKKSNSYPAGLAWDGTNLWSCDTKGPSWTVSGDQTFKLTAEGKLIEARQSPSTYPSGLTFDGQYLWTTDNGIDKILKLDPNTMEVLRTIDAPGGDYPNGLAFDGQYIWVSNNDSDSIYQIDIGIVRDVPINDPIAAIIDVKEVIDNNEVDPETPDRIITSIPEARNLLLYPNPTDGYVTVDLGEELENVTVIQRDMQGKIVQELNLKAIRNVRMEIIGEPGMYIVEVVEGTEHTALRVVKN